ncbi:MAG TPA: NAD(P)H-hydrate dehydratase [Acidimicrobiia bacterium]|nr:NAD(P)H-hydrate dehydratase [Acidimicrobiia bacterium]
MKLVITPEESGRLDVAAAARIDDLMDRAGYGVQLVAAAMGVAYGDRVIVLCGPGNNGGDGYVAARYLRRRGVDVRAYALAAPRAGTAAERALRATQSAGVAVADWRSEPEAADLIIDGLFGVGFRGAFPEQARAWLDTASPVLAIDVPSGLDAATGSVADAAFTAARTVTFHALKPGHLLGEGPERCGPVTLVDIGLEGGDPALMLCEAEDAPRPARERKAHKWSAGSVVVVGGSPGLTGAPLLTAQAALHGGAGAVTLMCPAELQGVYAAQAPGIMTRGVGRGKHFSAADVDECLAVARRFDVMVVGPGLGLEVGDFVTQLVLRWPGNLLVDADGLNALDGTGALRARQSPAILTPHAGEFRRLTSADPTFGAAEELARRTGSVVLLKGNPTFVAGGDGTWAVTSGGPELASIGTGDVLGGLVAALWARGLDAAVAARSGAYWHGRSGEALATSGTLTAAELASTVGRFAW